MPFSWVRFPTGIVVAGNTPHQDYEDQKTGKVTQAGGTPDGMGFRVEPNFVDPDAKTAEFAYLLFEWETTEIRGKVLAQLPGAVELLQLKTAAEADK